MKTIEELLEEATISCHDDEYISETISFDRELSPEEIELVSNYMRATVRITPPQ